MPLINLIIVLIIVGVLLYVVNRFIPMDGNIKSILNAMVIIAVVVWILAIFLGGFGSLNSIRVPSLK